jgi:tRNA/rRNA methyltransferase
MAWLMHIGAPCVILNEPQLAENIGAVARVMANFGLADLRLVRPRDGWPQPRAWASASGADWPLDAATVFERLEDAIADLRLVFATTARPRETLLPVHTPREAARHLRSAADNGWRAGLVFGGERAGLETADVALCQAIVTIPVDARFHSLNLAQDLRRPSRRRCSASTGSSRPNSKRRASSIHPKSAPRW